MTNEDGFVSIIDSKVSFISELETDKPTKLSVIKYPLEDKLVFFLGKYAVKESSATTFGTLLELSNDNIQQKTFQGKVLVHDVSLEREPQYVFGILNDELLNTSYVGEFNEGELNGIGVVVQNNNLSLGVFSKGEINGLGVKYIFGDVLLGQFVHGKLSGYGQHSSTTKTVSGVFLNGELVEETEVVSIVEKSMEVLNKSLEVYDFVFDKVLPQVSKIKSRIIQMLKKMSPQIDINIFDEMKQQSKFDLSALRPTKTNPIELLDEPIYTPQDNYSFDPNERNNSPLSFLSEDSIYESPEKQPVTNILNDLYSFEHKVDVLKVDETESYFPRTSSLLQNISPEKHKVQETISKPLFNSKTKNIQNFITEKFKNKTEEDKPILFKKDDVWKNIEKIGFEEVSLPQEDDLSETTKDSTISDFTFAGVSQIEKLEPQLKQKSLFKPEKKSSNEILIEAPLPDPSALFLKSSKMSEFSLRYSEIKPPTHPPKEAAILRPPPPSTPPPPLPPPTQPEKKFYVNVQPKPPPPKVNPPKAPPPPQAPKYPPKPPSQPPQPPKRPPYPPSTVIS
eukprot:snap_masked-scaffold_2-processed-gene-18.49-mRNA-1 protein AED:1.00 eAED:1.00 QI:0/-1/0/0/-1/1/1/0/564